MLDGVAAQVLHDAGEHLAVGGEHEPRRRIELHLEPRALDLAAHAQQHLAHQQADVETLELLTRLDVQQVGVLVQTVHQGAELDGLAMRGGEALALDGVEIGALQQLEVAAHRGQRGAQVVGDVRDEGADAPLLGAGAGRGLSSLLHGLVDPGGEPLELRDHECEGHGGGGLLPGALLEPVPHHRDLPQHHHEIGGGAQPEHGEDHEQNRHRASLVDGSGRAPP